MLDKFSKIVKPITSIRKVIGNILTVKTHGKIIFADINSNKILVHYKAPWELKILDCKRALSSSNHSNVSRLIGDLDDYGWKTHPETVAHDRAEGEKSPHGHL